MIWCIWYFVDELEDEDEADRHKKTVSINGLRAIKETLKGSMTFCTILHQVGVILSL